MTDAERLEEIRNRVVTTTAGPWAREIAYCPVDHEGCAVWPWHSVFDMNFAYAARADIPWLLEYIEELEADIEAFIACV